jgi:hypothetical protein
MCLVAFAVLNREVTCFRLTKSQQGTLTSRDIPIYLIESGQEGISPAA